jgi:homoserine kinase type II
VSVFTCITRPQLDQFFSAYALGEVISFEGITDGIDNTNYFVTTTQGSFVDRRGNLWRELSNKPAAVFRRLSGVVTTSPSILHCQEIGLQLASLHRCTQGYVFPVKNGNDFSWCKTVLNRIDAHLSETDRVLINDELAFQAENSPVDLPRGVIHGDLFRDNALFVDGQFSGLLDFYSACTDTLLLDIAITANDWCCDNGKVNDEKFTALLPEAAGAAGKTALVDHAQGVGVTFLVIATGASVLSPPR